MHNLSKQCSRSHDIWITCSATRNWSDLYLTQAGGLSPQQFHVTSTASAVSDNAPDTNGVDCHACITTQLRDNCYDFLLEDHTVQCIEQAKSKDEHGGPVIQSILGPESGHWYRTAQCSLSLLQFRCPNAYPPTKYHRNPSTTFSDIQLTVRNLEKINGFYDHTMIWITLKSKSRLAVPLAIEPEILSKSYMNKKAKY